MTNKEKTWSGNAQSCVQKGIRAGTSFMLIAIQFWDICNAGNMMSDVKKDGDSPENEEDDKHSVLPELQEPVEWGKFLHTGDKVCQFICKIEKCSNFSKFFASFFNVKLAKLVNKLKFSGHPLATIQKFHKIYPSVYTHFF